MPSFKQGPLATGGKFEEFSDGEGGIIRLEWRVDLETAALELWGGYPDDSADDRDKHGTLTKIVTLQA